MKESISRFEINMNKKIKESLSTVLIMVIALRLVNFEKMNVLDYVLIIVSAVYVILTARDLITGR